MKERCYLYFRREKPYIDGIVPLPFGIESRYIKYDKLTTKKDIDFVCVFGRDKRPLLRRFAKEILIKFCEKEKFTYRVSETNNQDEFLNILARAKVGISVGGGGFDTARFWEILGNNCLLLTENIDIYQSDDDSLEFQNIFQFNNLYDFMYELKKIGRLLRTDYAAERYIDVYDSILLKHSTRARILTVFKEAEKAGIASIF